MSSWPQRAFIQSFQNNEPAGDYKELPALLRGRGVPEVIVCRDLPATITRDDFICGNWAWSREAFQKLGIAPPPAPDYPECLKHLLHREIGTATLGDMPAMIRDLAAQGKQLFIKPGGEGEMKAFSAIVEPRDQMLDFVTNGLPGVQAGHGSAFPVFYSEVVDMRDEYRVYVVRGHIVHVALYHNKAEEGEQPLPLDMEVVEAAVATLAGCDEGRDVSAGCSIDFTVIKREATQQQQTAAGGGAAANDEAAAGAAAVQEEEEQQVQTCKAMMREDDESKSDPPPVEFEYLTALIEVNEGMSLGRYETLPHPAYMDLLLARWHQAVKPTSE